MVPKVGLEPTLIAEHAPKACASANFATSAGDMRIIPSYSPVWRCGRSGGALHQDL